MLVPVKVGPSPIEGTGLFLVERVATGTPVWRFVPGFDRVLEPAEVASWPEPARRHLMHFGYLDSVRGCWVLGGDLAIFMNHAAVPNTGAPGVEGAALLTVALRDLAAGEELTCNYQAFDAAGKPVR